MRFRDYYNEKMKDPEFAKGQRELDEQAAYYREHPNECPHEAIVAPIDESGEEQPGTCLDCRSENVLAKDLS